jgi:hypothetical protein
MEGQEGLEQRLGGRGPTGPQGLGQRFHGQVLIGLHAERADADRLEQIGEGGISGTLDA